MEEKTVEELEREKKIESVKAQLEELSSLKVRELMINKDEEALLKIAKNINYKGLEEFLEIPGNRLIMPLAEINGLEPEMAFFIWATRIGMKKRIRDVEFVQNVPEFKDILKTKYEEIGQNIALCIRCGQLTDYTIDELINGELRK